MKVSLRLIDGFNFAVETGSGHQVLMDGAPEHGGQDRGARPMEMILVGLAGCSAFDVVLILRKARQAVSDCRIEIEAERADKEPKVFTRINMKFKVYGEKLKDQAVARAIKLSAEKYCSVSIMLAKTAEISHHYEIIETTP